MTIVTIDVKEFVRRVLPKQFRDRVASFGYRFDLKAFEKCLSLSLSLYSHHEGIKKCCFLVKMLHVPTNMRSLFFSGYPECHEVGK
jgi:hypothetical protein